MSPVSTSRVAERWFVTCLRLVGLPGDLPCNPTKRKQVTNHRSATREVDTGLKAPRRHTLDTALEWIAEDELVEVTPESVRVRKAVLDATERKRIERRLAAL